MTNLPPNIAVLIEFDEHDPGGHDFGDEAENAAYTKKFETGELTCYGVSLVPLTEDGDVGCVPSRDSSMFYPSRLASLWGVGVETGGADGLYYDLKFIPDDYLREVAAELIAELPAAESSAPEDIPEGYRRGQYSDGSPTDALVPIDPADYDLVTDEEET